MLMTVRGPILRIILACYLAILRVVCLVVPLRQRAPGKEHDILITGTFHSQNWIASHLYPLAQSKFCERVMIVTIFPVPESDKVKVIYPPKLLRKIVGNVAARMITFFWIGIRLRPAIVGGFHLLFNGLAAALLGRLIQAHSIYFCVGGPAEVLGGGISSENKLFEKLKSPDAYIEQLLIASLNYFSVIVTMGTNAVTFFKEHGVQGDFHVVSGGIDSRRFVPGDKNPDIDLISVGRLVPIKRFDIFIKSVFEIRKVYPEIKAAIIGSGSLADNLFFLVKDLGLEENVIFAGFQENIVEWLQNSKIFILTSDSEGLSLAMMEAMMCGLPAIVSNVGDLGYLVEDNQNGFLINQRSHAHFANAVIDLLSNSGRLQLFSQCARQSAMKFCREEATLHWDNILRNL